MEWISSDDNNCDTTNLWVWRNADGFRWDTTGLGGEYNVSNMEPRNITITNVTKFSDWTISDISNPLPVEEPKPEEIIPKEYALREINPNPVVGTGIILYELPKPSNVVIEIYNITGQVVKTIKEGNKKAGFYSVKINTKEFANGVYFYIMKADEYRATKRMVILK